MIDGRQHKNFKRGVLSPGSAAAFVMALVVLTMFGLSCAWEFWLEEPVTKFLGFAYDEAAEREDHWHYILTAVGFVTMSLVDRKSVV